MRKIIALGIVLCFLCTAQAYAFSRVRVFESINTSGEYFENAVPTTTIVPGQDRILGVVVLPLTGHMYNSVLYASDTYHPECVVGLRDSVEDGYGGTVAEIIAEAECQEDSFDGEWFPYPLTVNTQLTIIQGGITIVYVYYTRG